MTTIHNFPQELLIEIFKNLKRDELTKVQTVCRTWYHPAHVLLLNVVELHGSSAVESFIAHIDQNTNPSYLAAVKRIEIGGTLDFGVEYYFDTDSIHKLISRFPNLRHVVIDSFAEYLKAFNDQVCQTIIEKCPKLESFRVFLGLEDYINGDVYFNTMYRFRSLVTALSLDRMGSAAEFGGIENYTARFPRLAKAHTIQ